MNNKTKIWIAVAIVYLLLPFDVIHDAMVGIGQLDDLIVIAIAVWQWYKEHNDTPEA